jgi:type II secretory pathway component PulM
MAAAVSAPSDAGSMALSYQRAGTQGSPLDALTTWWSGLTQEQRKWLLIGGGILLLVLIYEIF